MIARSAPRRRIVELLMQGKSRKAIADAMQRSPHTIDSQIKAIFAALEISDRAQLILIAQLVKLFGMYPPRKWGLAQRAIWVRSDGAFMRSDARLPPLRPNISDELFLQPARERWPVHG